MAKRVYTFLFYSFLFIPLSLGKGFIFPSLSSFRHESKEYLKLLYLAQEEAKCLVEFGAIEEKTEMEPYESQLYFPFKCQKVNESNGHEIKSICEKCQNLTVQLRTMQECNQEFCGIKEETKSDEKEVSLCEKCKRIAEDLFALDLEMSKGGLKRKEVQPDDINTNFFSKTPKVFCEAVKALPDDHCVYVSWKVKPYPDGTNPLVFLLEFAKESQEVGANTTWEPLLKGTSGLVKMKVDYLSSNYKWRVTAIDAKGVLARASSKYYSTINGYKSPSAPKRIYVSNWTVNSSTSINILIGWDQPEEKTCFFKLLLDRHDGDGRTKTTRIQNEPRGANLQLYQDLPFGVNYTVTIFSYDGSWSSPKEAHLDFLTPSCLEALNYNYEKCAPLAPQNISYSISLVNPEGRDGGISGRKILVTIKWDSPPYSSPTNQLKFYLLTFVEFNPLKPMLKGNTTTLKFLGNHTKFTVKAFKINSDYTVTLTGVSAKGSSPPTVFTINTTSVSEGDEGIGRWIYIFIPISVFSAIVLFSHFFSKFLRRRKEKLARDRYFKSMEEIETATDWSLVPSCTEVDVSTWNLFDQNFPREKWEIPFENLNLGEVVGQGAFGIVRKANYVSNIMESSLGKPKITTVAVKMLKANKEDKEYLIKEIQTMQSLGQHRQIVELLGASTRGRTLCLILEYCPGGNLLNYLRKVREKFWPMLGFGGEMEGSKNSTRQTSLIGSKSEGGLSTTDTMTQFRIKYEKLGVSGEETSHNFPHTSCSEGPINYADILKCKSSSSSNNSSCCERTSDLHYYMRKADQEKLSMDKCKRNSEEDEKQFEPIDERDVLSYARQVCLGMEFLEKNKVVHRDLAARNVLLMEDLRCVKISDFGLSRDIYTWNVYHQKSSERLPIKWMAIESIFAQVFSSKSDVWSFGILLWELVTLGAIPYPGLGNSNLFNLLKSGYRMERPDNCSEELYALMKKCWRSDPSSRPNFTELRFYIDRMMDGNDPSLYLTLQPDIPSNYFTDTKEDFTQIFSLSSETRDN